VLAIGADESRERVLRGQRIRGVVRVTDAPADGQGRTYVVARDELESKDELDGLVAHYVEHARRCDDVPLLHLCLADEEAARSPPRTTTTTTRSSARSCARNTRSSPISCATT
jgi:hypothetical protein